ncbi:MAG TPA: hypothetical protein HA294_04960 [Nanoarchaeota archaeon]|nr:hypothetical protein [Candidatus Woesearchaeota archaeon]HIH59331.1 hypothetical protein [Nanoarchaeota archaeon]HIJ04788.1 hypothetical protein [Nanoarchaeota archaeon]
MPIHQVFLKCKPCRAEMSYGKLTVNPALVLKSLITHAQIRPNNRILMQ